MHFRSFCAVEQHEKLRAVCGGSGDDDNDGFEARDVDSMETVSTSDDVVNHRTR